jgi:hypothetical protein
MQVIVPFHVHRSKPVFFLRRKSTFFKLWRAHALPLARNGTSRSFNYLIGGNRRSLFADQFYGGAHHLTAVAEYGYRHIIDPLFIKLFRAGIILMKPICASFRIAARRAAMEMAEQDL